MRQIVAGSIATDHLMVFPGRFTELFVEGKLDKVSLSFLVDELKIHRGGVAANVAFGMARLGLKPVLVGAVGSDFAEYQEWLEAHQVDTGHVRVSADLHTARFLCTTDADNNQIASFYAGAMSEARNIDLAPLGDLDLVVVSPNDPEAMLRHTDECRTRGIPFAADPSQQLARMEGEDVRQLIDGAAYLFTNEYEKALAEQKTGWSDGEILGRVGVRVTTLGPKGVIIDRVGEEGLHVPAAPEEGKVDPTGVGDAFRAGFLSATSWGLSLERAAQVGNLIAAHALESAGCQEYTLAGGRFIERLTHAYGDEAAADVTPHLAG
jgi:adenosine kinase